MLELTQEEVNKAVIRATQIAEEKVEPGQPANPAASFESYVAAAEEIGIPRDAMLQALREQHVLPLVSYQAGDQVFAKSVDGAYYAASITDVNEDGTAQVQFISGSHHRVTLKDLRPFALIPGAVLQFQDEAQLGSGIWYSGKLVEYNADRKKVTMTLVGTSYTVPITMVRLKPTRVSAPKLSLSTRALLTRAIAISSISGVGVGFVLAYILFALLHR